MSPTHTHTVSSHDVAPSQHAVSVGADLGAAAVYKLRPTQSVPPSKSSCPSIVHVYANPMYLTQPDMHTVLGPDGQRSRPRSPGQAPVEKIAMHAMDSVSDTECSQRTEASAQQQPLDSGTLALLQSGSFTSDSTRADFSSGSSTQGQPLWLLPLTGQGAYPSQRDGKGSSGVPGVLCQGARQGGSESTADLLAPPCAVPPPGNMTLPASSSAREDLGTGSSSGGCSSTRGGSGGSGGGSMRGSSMRSSGGGGIGRSIEPMLTEVRSLKLTVTAALASLSGSGRPQASLTGSSKPVSPVNDALGQVEALSSQLPAQLARVDHLLEQLEAYRASAEQRQRPGNNANSIATQLRLLLQNLMRWRRTVVWPPAPTASLTASSREERCSRSAPQPGYLEPKQPASSSCQELESQLRQPQPVAGTSAVTGASLPGTGVASQLVEVALDLLIASPADLTAPHLSANGVGAVEALSLSSEPGAVRQQPASDTGSRGDAQRVKECVCAQPAQPQELLAGLTTAIAASVPSQGAGNGCVPALSTSAACASPKGHQKLVIQLGESGTDTG